VNDLKTLHGLPGGFVEMPRKLPMVAVFFLESLLQITHHVACSANTEFLRWDQPLLTALGGGKPLIASESLQQHLILESRRFELLKKLVHGVLAKQHPALELSRKRVHFLDKFDQAVGQLDVDGTGFTKKVSAAALSQRYRGRVGWRNRSWRRGWPCLRPRARRRRS